MLSIDQVCGVNGLNPQVLRNWINDGLVKPTVQGGSGRGKGHRFSVTQAVGLVVAAELHRSERSCALSYVGKVVTAFAAVPEAELLAKFKEGGKHFVTLQPQRDHEEAAWNVILSGKRYDWPNVFEAYQKVKAVAELQPVSSPMPQPVPVQLPKRVMSKVVK